LKIEGSWAAKLPQTNPIRRRQQKLRKRTLVPSLSAIFRLRIVDVRKTNNFAERVSKLQPAVNHPVADLEMSANPARRGW
jgi:hypothetical protein